MLVRFPSRRTKTPLWRQRQREQERWLFVAGFVLILLAGLAAFAVFDGFAPSPELNAALLFAAVFVTLAAPPPVLRFFWHEFANRWGVKPPTPVLSPHVIDGDTIHDVANGLRYRLANIDAPETGDNAKCHRERERGEDAKSVAHQLVANATRVEVRTTFRMDQYGRRIAFVLVDGVDLGEILVQRGLARPWRGTRRRWCGRNGGLAKIAQAGLKRHACSACAHWRN
jgi:endonuclease YncB( thermonuclease family)